MPEEIKLVRDATAATVCEVLEHLSRHWDEMPPARSEMRQRVLSTLNVAHGFDNLLRAVSAEQGSPELDEITEAWTVENESTGGFGAALPAREGDWLEIGTLVASKPTWPASWSVGIIRRLSTDESGRRAVGVQIIARGGVAVQIEPLPLGEKGRPRTAILLPGETQNSMTSGEITLLLPRDVVSFGVSYALRVHQRTYSIVPVRVADSGEDFDIVTCTIDQAAAA